LRQYSCSKECFAVHCETCLPPSAPSVSTDAASDVDATPAATATATAAAAAAPPPEAAAAAAVAAVPAVLRGCARVAAPAASAAAAASLGQLPEENLARMRHHGGLRAALRDSGLQHIITAIISPAPPAATMGHNSNSNNRNNNRYNGYNNSSKSESVEQQQRRLLAELCQTEPRFSDFLGEMLRVVDDSAVAQAARDRRDRDEAVSALLRGERP